jgi:hypothetical protein
MHRLAAATLMLLASACVEPTVSHEELVATDGTKTLSRVVSGRTETLIARDNGRLVGVTKVSHNSQGAAVTVTPAGRASVTYFATKAQLAVAALKPNLDYDYDGQGISGPGDTPWGCGWIGRALLLSAFMLIFAATSASPLAPLAFLVATLAVANNVNMYARCQEWYLANPGAP